MQQPYAWEIFNRKYDGQLTCTADIASGRKSLMWHSTYLISLRRQIITVDESRNDRLVEMAIHYKF